MRYSVDAAGVAKVSSDVAACFEDVAAAVSDALGAVDDAAGSLHAEAAGVAGALEAVFATRQDSGRGLSARADEILAGVENGTLAYVAGDEQMAAQTTSAAAVAPLLTGASGRPWRGFGPVIG